ncbi:MAG: thioredoxin-like domain-containing protein [Bacteroidales bacterium]|jgi:hypothetical protein|nr:thioredoxin-like domain-containing protein [Bacteroidales bacterium]
MKKSILLHIFLLSFVINGFSEMTTISGTLKNGSGYTVRLMTYNDQLSYIRKTLASTVAGEDERFSLSVDISAVTYCWIDIEFQQAELFIQPGQSYEVEIDLAGDPLSMSYYNRRTLDNRIIRDDSMQLNNSIQDFNEIYNDFLLNISDNIRQQNSRVAYETFMTAVELRFQGNSSEYFDNYIRYKSASMQLFMRIKSREKIGTEFLADRPVLFNHLEYMDFFHLYFDKYFVTNGKYFNYSKTYDMINGKAPLAEILDSLAVDPALKQRPAMELLLLCGLKGLYSMPEFSKDRITALVKELTIAGSQPGIRELAANLLVRFKRLKPGSPAPGFALETIAGGQKYSLPDFTGKKLYLAFFESDNPASQSELGQISEIYDEFKNDVSFVAVSVDKNRDRLMEYIDKADAPWLFLHYGGDLDLLENYDAVAFPCFILIGADGKIIRCPAPSPSENIRKLFD